MKIPGGGARKQEGRSQTQYERPCSARAFRAFFGAGPAKLKPPSTAHGSQLSVVFDNCPDVGVEHPTGSGLMGPTSMPKPNDA
jgi:hypothetical protein